MKRTTSHFIDCTLLCLLMTILAAGSAMAIPGDLKWFFTGDGGGMFQGGVAISANGTVYAGCTDGKLYAITPSGTKEWAFNTNSKIYNATPAIAPDGTIYFGARNGNIYAVNPDGTQKWTEDTQAPIESTPAISSNGTVFITQRHGFLLGFYPDGSSALIKSMVYQGSPAISANGTIYCGGSDGRVYAKNPDFTNEWDIDISEPISESISISSNGTLYVPAGQKLMAVSKAGAKLWEYDAGGTIFGAPVISSNGTIYVSEATNSRIHAVNPDGTLAWTYKTAHSIKSAPVLSNDGTIYFTIDLDLVNALSPAGVLKWTASSNDGAKGTPAIGPDGTVYTGTNNNHVLAVEGNGAGLMLNAWPKPGRDQFNTGRNQPFWTLPDTGQTKCYNAAGDEISCPASGAAFYGQDAQYNGSQPHFELYVDNTVGNVTKDLNTNLMWQYKGGAKMSSADSEPYCKNLAYGGYTDWRLPTAYESRTILNYNSSNLCYSSFVCNSSYYWTGSRNSRSTARRYYINLNYGGSLGATAFGSYFVRCVRGQLNPPSYLAANGSKIVKDASTGLVWQRDGSTAGAITWENSLSYCENLDLAGKTDWRLPNVMELISIADFNNASLAVSSQFTNMHGNSYYWTSTTAPNAAQALSNKAMAVAFSNMGTGYASIGVDAFLKTSTTTYTLCVRDGSADSPDRTATLTGAPSGTTTATTATITVGGTGIVSYRHKLDSGNFSEVTPTALTIRLSGLAKGAHTLQVLGISQEGKLQANPTTATWTVSSGGGGGSNSTNSSSKTNVIQTKDGTNPHTNPNAANADTGITFPSYQTSQYDITVDAELKRLGFGAMARNLTTYEGWQSSVTDSTALTYLKSNDSTDIATGLNLLSTNGTVDRVLTGMINATSTTTNLGYALFIRNTTNLAKTYNIDDTRYAKVMGNTVTLFTMAPAPFSSSVTSDLYAYLRKTDGSVVTGTFTGEVSACVWIKDNGAFDADPTPGSVADPGYVSTLETSETTGSSSSGCMLNPGAGLGLEWLLMLLAPVLWLIRTRRAN